MSTNVTWQWISHCFIDIFTNKEEGPVYEMYMAWSWEEHKIRTTIHLIFFYFNLTKQFGFGPNGVVFDKMQRLYKKSGIDPT